MLRYFCRLCVLVLVFSTMSLRAATGEDAEILRLQMTYPYTGSWKLPNEFSVGRIQQLLQEMVDSVAGIGFRFIGDANDFDHGHLLFRWNPTKNPDHEKLEAFAILYHTQEHAYAAYWGNDLPEKYSYLDVRNRNWIQWLAGDNYRLPGLIENARVYADPLKKDISLFYGNPEPVFDEHYTIHSKNLSPDKLGYRVVGELQFIFSTTECDRPVIPVQGRGPLVVFNASGEKICMVLTTNTEMLNVTWFRKRA